MSEENMIPVTGAASKRSLGSRLTELVAAEERGEAAPPAPGGAIVEPPAPAAEVIPPPRAEPAKVEPVEEVIEHDFSDFDLGGATETPPPAADAPSFDAAAFDRETEELANKQGSGASDAFRKLRNELKEFKTKTNTKEVEELRQKVESLELEAKKTKALEETVTKLSKKDAQLAVQASTEYQSQVIIPAGKIETRVIEMAEAMKVEPEQIMAIIKANDLDAETMMEEMNMTRRGQETIYKLSDQWREICHSAKHMIDNAEKTMEEIRTNEAKTAQDARKAEESEIKREQTSTFKKYSEIIPGMMKDGVLTEEAKLIESKLLNTDVFRLSKRDLALATFAARALPSIVKRLQQAERDLNAYRKGQKPTNPLKESTPVQTTPDAEAKPRGLMARMHQELGRPKDD